MILTSTANRGEVLRGGHCHIDAAGRVALVRQDRGVVGGRRGQCDRHGAVADVQAWAWTLKSF